MICCKLPSSCALRCHHDLPILLPSGCTSSCCTACKGKAKSQHRPSRGVHVCVPVHVRVCTWWICGRPLCIMIILSCRPQDAPAAKKSLKRRRPAKETARSKVGVSIGGFNGMLHAYLEGQTWKAADGGRDNKFVVFKPMLGGDGYCFWRSLDACVSLLKLLKTNDQPFEFPVHRDRRVDYGSAGPILFNLLDLVAISQAAPLQYSRRYPYIAFVCRSRDAHWSVVVQQPNHTHYINESKQYYKAGEDASALVQFFAEHNDDLQHQMWHLHLPCHHQ